MKGFRLPLLLTLLLAASQAAAVDRYYAPRVHESKWTVRSSALECVMAQDIPRYGTAMFVQKAGDELKFQVRVRRAPIEVDYARLSSMPPNWRYDVPIRELGKVTILKSKTPIEVESVRAHRMLSELQTGMFPTLRYEDWFDGRDDVQVSISAVNIEEPLDQFFECLAGILPYDLEDVAESTFFYLYGVEDLSQEQKGRLDQIADYVVVDSGIRSIVIDSYTDSIGYRRKNLEESQRRAGHVRDYLVSRGISPELVVINAHGEKDPKYDNATEEGRAKNRRVTIKVSKEQVMAAEEPQEEEVVAQTPSEQSIVAEAPSGL